MKRNYSGFTFVELIVVLVIIAILSTIGFTVYESYLGTGRDAKRIVTLTGLQQSLGTFATKSQLPFPEENIKIQASGNNISYIGNITNDIAKMLNFKGSIFDKELSMYPVYMLDKNRKDFQLMTFLEDPVTNQIAMTKALALEDYLQLTPKTLGKPLGILLDSNTGVPIFRSETFKENGIYDIFSGTGSFIVYFSDKNFFNTNNQDISQILPNQSCKRILEMGNSRGNGEYIISPTGSGNIRVYCDMRTDGGGWTFVAFIDYNNSEDNLFSSNVNTYMVNRSDSAGTYSIDASKLSHEEMMISYNHKDPEVANAQNQVIGFKYNAGNTLFYSGPTPCSKDTAPIYRAGIYGVYSQRGGIDIRRCTENDYRILQTFDSDEFGLKGDLMRITSAGVRSISYRVGSEHHNSLYLPAWVYVR